MLQPKPHVDPFFHQVAWFITSRAFAKDVRIESATRLTGGAIQENWLLSVKISGGPYKGSHNWVLRRDSASSVGGSLSRINEFNILTTVHGAGVRVPRPLWCCDEQEVGQGSYFLMEWVKGDTAGYMLTKDLPADGNPSLAAQLGANLARLHCIRPGMPALDFISPPDTNPVFSSLDIYAGFLDSLDDAYPALEWGMRWLRSNAPTPEASRLLHRDYRTGNYLVSDGQLQAVLDWEFAGWGDPREDIGWFTSRSWRFARPDLEAGGIGRLEDFLDGYQQILNLDLSRDDLIYWQVLATLRWAIIALQQAQRHISGQERSLELALTAWLVPELELRILRLCGDAAL